MSLYNKYRPDFFRDVVSQETTVTALKEQLINNNFSQAYIMAGTRGTGKTTASKLFSKYVTCESPSEGEPCNECASCIDAKAGTHPDIYEIDGASNNSVDHVRSIIDEIKYPPMRSKYKVYIIDEVHMLSGSAFNALLKTLEEPPSHVIFILATTELYKIPATIRSRCQLFTFSQIEVEDISKHLLSVSRIEGINLQEDGAKLIAESAEGSMRDGLTILEQLSHNHKIDAASVEKALGLINESHTTLLIEFLIERDAKCAMTVYKEILNLGKTTTQLTDSLIKYLTGQIMLGDRVSQMTHALKKLIDFRREVQKESNVQLLFNLFIVDLCSEQSTDQSELAEQIKRVNKKVIEIESFIKKPASQKIYQSENNERTPDNEVVEKHVQKVTAISEEKIPEENTVNSNSDAAPKVQSVSNSASSEQSVDVDIKKVQSDKVQSILGKLNKFQVKV